MIVTSIQIYSMGPTFHHVTCLELNLHFECVINDGLENHSNRSDISLWITPMLEINHAAIKNVCRSGW